MAKNFPIGLIIPKSALSLPINQMNQNKFVDDWGIIADEVRLLPYGGGGNVIVSRKSYEREINWRKEQIKAGIPFELPTWESLRVYVSE